MSHFFTSGSRCRLILGRLCSLDFRLLGKSQCMQEVRHARAANVTSALASSCAHHRQSATLGRDLADDPATHTVHPLGLNPTGSRRKHAASSSCPFSCHDVLNQHSAALELRTRMRWWRHRRELLEEGRILMLLPGKPSRSAATTRIQTDLVPVSRSTIY